VNVGILLVGIVGGLLVGGGLEWQAGRSRQRATALEHDGLRLPGTVTAIDAVGKYNSHRRITVEVEGGSFVETVPFVEADQLGVAVGSTVATLVAHDDRRTGRIDRPIDASSRRGVGVGLGLFIAVLGLVAALVV
jgi:hypothetical protein